MFLCSVSLVFSIFYLPADIFVSAGGQGSFRRPRSQSQHSASSNLDLVSTGTTVTATSNQINQQKQKHKRDYENLLLLQKIQNVKPSRNIEASFGRMRLN